MTGSSGGDLDGNMFFNAYQEGIYVGYRYYETRYADAIAGTGNTAGYDYLADVAYPFGYGLSYTTFEYSDLTFTPSADGKSIDVTVTVTNTGDVAGKEVVQVYFQSEYTDYDRRSGIEKAAVELCGFDKTEKLEPGASETVTITVDKERVPRKDRRKICAKASTSTRAGACQREGDRVSGGGIRSTMYEFAWNLMRIRTCLPLNPR